MDLLKKAGTNPKGVTLDTINSDRKDGRTRV
jgi:hypothetical protein